MIDLSLHILDIAENAYKAKAKNVTIEIISTKEFYDIIISDDGIGMSQEKLQKVTSPFFTSRTTRKIGLGIPLFKQTLEQAGGFLKITSTLNIGTCFNGRMYKNSIDSIPLGDIGETILLLMLNEQNINITFKYQSDEQIFKTSRNDILEILEGTPLSNPKIMNFIKDYVNEGINNTGEKL